MTKTITSAGYVVYDTQKTAIYGFGDTVDIAWAGVMRELDRPVSAFTNEPVSDDEWFAQFRVEGATQALLDAVQETGGNLAWQSINGVACTPAEHEAFYDA